MFALVVVLVCLATVEADPIKIEIDATGHVGGASALNPAAGGNVNKLGDEDEDEDDFFDAAELARRAEMLKENQIKASAGPPRPTAPIPKSQDSYDWRNTELTSHMWRIIHEGNVEEVQRTILDQPECVHVRSEDGRGGTTMIVAVIYPLTTMILLVMPMILMILML